MLLTTIEIISWIAVFFTLIVGIPQLVYVLRFKKVEGLSFIAFWTYFAGLMLFVLFGYFSGFDQVIYGNVIGGLIFTATMATAIYYASAKQLSRANKIIQYIFVIIFGTIIIIFGLLHTLEHKNVNLIQGLSVAAKATPSSVLAHIAPICTTLAFLPQTIKGIRQKSLFYLPAFFIFDLPFLNFLWIIAFSLKIWAISSGQSTEPMIAIASVLGYQFISFAIALAQMSFWLKQIRGKKIVWI